MLGTICFQTGKIEESVDYFRKAIALNPGNHELHYQLGCALLGVRYRDDAIASLRQSLSIKADFFDAWVTLGNAYAWGGQLQESVDSYQQAMRINPGNPVPYCNLANVLSDQGKVEEAIKQLETGPAHPARLHGGALQHAGRTELHRCADTRGNFPCAP